MGFQVSPGVAIREIDLTNVIPAVSTSIGATVINGTWGPVEEIITITNEKELVDTFGVPTNETAESFFTAASFWCSFLLAFLRACPVRECIAMLLLSACF